jgi:hypothetical protein
MKEKRKKSNRYAPGKPAALRCREREQRACKLRLAGHTYQAIADTLGFASKAAARNAIIRALMRLPPCLDAQKLRQAEVIRCDEIEREAIEQWHRSTEDAVKISTKTLSDGRIEVTHTVEGQSGNPALLGVMLRAMERRAAILGLDAPAKLAVSNDTELRIIGQNAAEVFEKAIERLKDSRH